MLLFTQKNIDRTTVLGAGDPKEYFEETSKGVKLSACANRFKNALLNFGQSRR